MNSSMQQVHYETHRVMEEGLLSEMAELYWSDFVPEELRNKTPEFYSKERFFSRMDGYAERPYFRCITAHHDGALIGFITTASLISSSTWWEGMQPEVSAHFCEEDGARTLAIFDALVARSFRGQGIATNLHQLAVKDIPCKRVTLLSSEPQQPAYSMWQRFGYKIIGHKEMDNGPELAVFLREV